MELTESEIQRYSRHIILQDVGGKGQLKLKRAKVLLIGAGGLGSPAGLYLAAAGIGTIGLVDGDVVDLSNLQRQIMHSTTTLGQPKVESGRKPFQPSIRTSPSTPITSWSMPTTSCRWSRNTTSYWMAQTTLRHGS